MKDPFGREIKNIRISLNDECNLHCYYCHHEGQQQATGTMKPPEIKKVLMLSRKLGITKVKFTGGEPLLRDDILEIIGDACILMDDISVTTNGTFPPDLAVKLREAGLSRINISLDTIDRQRYESITGEDRLSEVLNFIKTCVSTGLFPVKINIVWLADSSHEDLMRTVNRVWMLGAKPQLIQLVDIDDEGRTGFSEIEKKIANRAVAVKKRTMHRRKIYSLKDQDGNLKEIEVVRPMHNTEFCENCSRIRLTSNGYLKPCLMHNSGLVNILGPMREGAKENELMELFKSAIDNRYPYWRN